MKSVLLVIIAILVMISIPQYNRAQHYRQLELVYVKMMNDKRSDINTLCEAISDQNLMLDVLNNGHMRKAGLSWVKDVTKICD